jgi:anti-sigma factor RsiW
MNSETPFAGDVPGGDDDVPYEWLDEWLCEYVDGTMDPSLEAVFEQYVEANPELKAHVQRLKETRRLLCECGLPPEASSDDEMCREEECDPHSSPPLSEVLQNRPAAALGFASTIAVALVVGFLVGATVPPTFSPRSTRSSPSTTVESQEPVSPSPDAAQVSDPPLPRFSTSFSASDSTQSPSPLTTIGLP